MKLKNLLTNLTTTELDLNIAGVALNSKQINKNWAFVAIAGVKTHGADFVSEAIENGCIVIFSDRQIKAQIPVIVIEDLANKLDILADNFYTQAKSRGIIAITGTNGKTSIASFISQILTNLNVKNQVIGTLTNALTTPDIFNLYQQLNDFDGTTILEVSSHALAQKRVKGLSFKLAIWSNLTQDHLDYHQTMEQYLQAKLLICKQSKFGIFNADDEFYPQFADKLPHNSYSLEDIKLQVQEFGFLCELDDTIFETNVLGRFNIYNLLASYQALLKLGFDKLEVLKSIANITPVLGRMQKIENQNIWIDFAHTPDGLKNALLTLKEHYPANKITVVFGCGGDRDKGKRAKMGKIAGDLADRIILTNDNPRSENPEDIVADIRLGTNKELQVILDRKLAIEAGISETGIEGYEECILIAGKGAEQFQIIGDEKVEFSDFSVIENLLK